jgi:hypothetical protein
LWCALCVATSHYDLRLRVLSMNTPHRLASGRIPPVP